MASELNETLLQKTNRELDEYLKRKWRSATDETLATQAVVHDDSITVEMHEDGTRHITFKVPAMGARLSR